MSVSLTFLLDVPEDKFAYEDHMMVTCAGSSSPKDTERAFFRRLAEFDPDMIINTNYSGKED